MIQGFWGDFTQTLQSISEDDDKGYKKALPLLLECLAPLI